MKAMRLWQGVRMRAVAARPEPDAPPRPVTLPASWDDRAAEALAALHPGTGPVSLAGAATVWLGLIASRARHAPGGDTLVRDLHGLLLRRQAAPNAPVWRGEMGGDAAAAAPGMCLNAANFFEAGTGFDAAAFRHAAACAAAACRLLAPDAPRYEIGLSGLDDLLACAGLPYDSAAARDVAACLAALLRASTDGVFEGAQRDLLATGAPWPAPPSTCAFPGLAEAARAARTAIRHVPGAVPATGVFPPGPADALLGVETGGIAPAFAPVRDRHLTRAAQSRLAAASMSPEAALAAVLDGGRPLPTAGHAAHAAMADAVRPFLHQVASLEQPPEPASTEAAAPPAGRHSRRTLPPRPAGLIRRALVGGHPVGLRTAEFVDGQLGEISLALPRESAAVRGLADCVAQAVSLGLQHGVPLAEFADVFTHTAFGPAGPVEGDEDVARATSVLDYVFRVLSAAYLGRVLPSPPAEAEVPAGAAATAPLLPLDLPAVPGRRRSLRLVA